VSYKNVFRRYELKFLLTPEQKEAVLSAMSEYMRLDEYGRTTIRNIYFDDDSFRLIRRSIEKPSYKEKLRVRSYGRAEHDSPVFVELKKKYDGIVYKRRISLPESLAMDWLGGGKAPVDSQICREIQYFMSYYKGLHPSLFLSYEREAYYLISGGDFRVTFDENIFARRHDLSLTSEAYGKSVLPEGKTLMEIKCSGAIPLWMTDVLSKNKIYKTSFSKYGRAYIDHILPSILIKKEQ
jgi:SPX domain protein involved in polyphosphate accumulation